MAGSGSKNKTPDSAKRTVVPTLSADQPKASSGGIDLFAVLAAEPPSRLSTPQATGPTTDKRKVNPDVDEGKLAELGLRGAVVSNAAGNARHGNQRRSPGTIKLVLALVGVLLTLFACFGAMLYSYYQRTLAPEIQALKREIAARGVPRELESSTALVTMRADLSAAQNQLTKATEQITSLQKQISALQDKQDAADERMGNFAQQMQNSLTGSKSTEAQSSASKANQIASVVQVATPVNQELWLLKERNRLTLYADQAIAQGSSEAMTNLWRSLEDPELKRLREGVQAEIIRVQNYYSHLSRLPPDYRLPVRDLFSGDSSIRSEADLRPEQLINLLLDQKQAVEIRARSAYVLGGHRSDDVAKALIQCMKIDPVLDVVKEAQRTLAEDYSMRVPPLHLKAADEWWQARSGAK